MLEAKFKKSEPFSPTRCQAVVKQGQCPFEVIPGQTRCQMHSAGGLQEKAGLTNYRLTIWQKRLNELSNSDAVKSLRDEIGLLRLTLESVVNNCKDANDLLIYSGKISDLAVKIEKLVVSCHKLELSSGTLLDKQSVLQLASNLVDIITRHITNIEDVEIISEEILMAVANMNIIKQQESLMSA